MEPLPISLVPFYRQETRKGYSCGNGISCFQGHLSLRILKCSQPEYRSGQLTQMSHNGHQTHMKGRNGKNNACLFQPMEDLLVRHMSWVNNDRQCEADRVGQTHCHLMSDDGNSGNLMIAWKNSRKRFKC